MALDLRSRLAVALAALRGRVVTPPAPTVSVLPPTPRPAVVPDLAALRREAEDRLAAVDAERAAALARLAALDAAAAAR